MKTLLTLALLSLATTAFAGDENPADGAPVKLDRKELTVTENPVTIARTAATPKKVTVNLPVQIATTTCLRYDTRTVFGQDPSCGYDSVIRYRCPSTYNDCQRVCHGGSCHTVCRTHRPSCYSYVDRYMRSCNHPETYCAQTGVVNSTALRSVKIKFKRLPELSGDQAETFKLGAKQRSVDSGYTLYDLQSEQTLGQYEIDVRQNAEKIVIKRK